MFQRHQQRCLRCLRGQLGRWAKEENLFLPASLLEVKILTYFPENVALKKKKKTGEGMAPFFRWSSPGPRKAMTCPGSCALGLAEIQPESRSLDHLALCFFHFIREGMIWKHSVYFPMIPGFFTINWGHVTKVGQWNWSRNCLECVHERLMK